jgi:hypothetical protein
MNPYVVGWQRLNNDVQDEILGHAGRRVVEEYAKHERPLPEELGDPFEDPWPETIQTYSFERSRESIFALGGPLTVTFSDCVNRSWSGFAREAGSGGEDWPLDKDAVCAAMDFKQSWTGVSKIRMPVENWASIFSTNYLFRFVRQGEDGQEEIVSASHLFKICGTGYKIALARKLTEDLHLRHAVVNGVDEYSVA